MKTKQYAAHPLTTTQSELPSAILSALTIALLSALLFTSCSKHHYLELLLDPDGEPIENPGRILLSAPGVANPLLPAILTDPAREDRIVATVLHDQPVDVEAGTYNLLCTLPTDGSNTEYFGTDAFTLNGTTISLPLLAPDGRLPQAPDVLTDATPVTVTSGRTIQTALTPAPRTRLVRLDVRLQGADASSITAITARLEGVHPHRPRSHRYLPPPGHGLLSHRPTHPHYRYPRGRHHPELRARRHLPLLRLQPARHSHYPTPGSHPQLRYRPSERHHHTLDTRMERGRNGTLKSSSSLAFLPHKTYLCLRKTTTSTLIKTFNETTRTIPLSLS